MKKTIIPVLALLFGMGLFIVPNAQAQYGVGVSTEFRDKVPNSGYGIRVERYIGIPFVEVGARLHFSYFQDERSLPRIVGGVPTIFDEQTAYDYGISAIGKIKILPLFNPYVTLGIGREHLRYTSAAATVDEAAVMYTSSFGVEFSLIPFIKPFAEYRITEASFDKIRENGFNASGGRFMAGVLVRI